MRFITLASLVSTVCALPPFAYSPPQFISGNNQFKVASVNPVPSDFIENLSASSSASKEVNDLGAPAKYSNTSSASNTSSTILNIIPGISLLQTDDNNECYFVNTTIGTVEYPLIVDTGSAYLWVYGSDCDDEPCQNEEVYTASGAEASTATSTFNLAYVTGSASGTIVEDNIIVNKLATTQKFKFGKASTVPAFFGNYPVSGIFGLPSNDSSPIKSIISALYDSNAIGVKRFSISLGELNENDSNHPNAGIFSIGEPIEELYEGEIHYVDLIPNPSHYWLITIDNVSIDNYSLNFTNEVEVDSTNSSTIRTAIVDSGTTVLALPKKDALDIHSYFTDSVSDGTNYAIYCNSTLEITLEIGGRNWTITPEQYLGNEYPESSGYGGYCVSNIQGIDSSAQESWILGALFLKTVYADFDIEEQRIGFAERNTQVVLTSTATSTQTASASEATATDNIVTTSLVNGTSTTASSSSFSAGANYIQGNSPYFTILSSLFALVLL